MRTHLQVLSIITAALTVLAPLAAHAQTRPQANGETLRIQYIGGSVANYQAIVADKKGLCTKYNFKCENKAINAGTLALQALLGNTVDVVVSTTDTAIASIAQGADLVIVATLRQVNPFVVAVRPDVPLPNKAKGYIGVVQDLKGKKIGVSGRGSGLETNYVALMAAAGLSPSDVTFVPLGGPPPAYQALTVGKLVDALVMFEPIQTLCTANKTCDIAIDLTTGDGPPVIKAMNGAVITLVMRRDMVEKNPKLVQAYVAAMQEATRWARDPANFEEVVKLYEPIVNFGTVPNADAMRRTLLKAELASASPGMETSRPALKAIVDFALANKTIDQSVPVEKLLWKDAP